MSFEFKTMVKALSLVSKKKKQGHHNGIPFESNWLDEVQRFLKDKQEDQGEQPVPREIFC